MASRPLLWGAIAVAALGVLGVWVLTERAPWPASDRGKVGSGTGGDPTSEMQGIEVVDVDPDGTRWRLSARSGTAWEKEETGTLLGVEALFEKEGNAIRVSAGRGELEAGRTVNLSDGVKVSWDAYEAVLDHATYERGTGMISSDAPVVLTGPGMIVRGTGVEVDVEGKRAQVQANVQTIFQRELP
jgi:LPS export ABC transporter protein LptC